jgi:hypothetical protein
VTAAGLRARWRLAALLVVVFAAAVGAANAIPPSRLCADAGLSASGVKKTYGAAAHILPQAPNSCAVVFYVKHGSTVNDDAVATVSFYPKGEWASLTGQVRHVAQRVVYLKGLGKSAVLFDTARAPFYYSEQIDFIVRSLAIVITPQASVTATSPPGAASAKTTALAAAVFAKLS